MKLLINTVKLSVSISVILFGMLHMSCSSISSDTAEKIDIDSTFDSENYSSATAIVVEGGDVFVAGSYNSKACYWKNSELVLLEDSSSYATCLYIDNGDVYVGGQHEDIPCYWKNGVRYDLIPETSVTSRLSPIFYPKVLSIAKHGSDLYITLNTEEKSGYTVLWINGKRSDSIDGIEGAKIIFDNDDIYIIGKDSYYSLCYWKNYQVNYIYGCNNFTDITLYNGDLYISGGTAGNTAAYWKNGEQFLLPNNYKYWVTGVTDSISTSYTSGIVVDSNSISLSGMVFTGSVLQACYWKDNTLNVLYNGDNPSTTTGICSYNGSLYISGHRWNDAGTSNACYWKDGTIIYLK